MRFVLLLLVLLAIPMFAFADAGLPMIFVTFPKMVFALLPVIGLEVLVFYRYGFPIKKALLAITLANGFSTLIGIPISWVLLVMAELLFVGVSSMLPVLFANSYASVIWQAPWLFPPEEALWRVPVAMLVLLIPFFWVSYVTENWVIELFMKDNVLKAKNACWQANVFSYSVLALYPCGLLVYFMVYGLLPKWWM